MSVDFSEKKQLEDSLRRVEETLRHWVEGAKDYAVLILDPEGVLLHWNEGIERLTGYQAQEIIGKKVTLFDPQNSLEKVSTNWSQVLEQHQIKEEGYRQKKDGHLFFARIVTTVLRDREGVLIGFSQIMRDITESKKARDEIEQKNIQIQEHASKLEDQTLFLKKLNQDLEKANHYKSEFLANMSHELRTPLNSILILSKILVDSKEQPLPTTQKEHASMIYSCGKDLLELINDILDLSKIEAGKLEIEKSFFSLKEFFEKLYKLFYEQLLGKESLQFELEVNWKYLPAFFYSDPKRLEQILKNFLSNAFKFTEKGKIVLKVLQQGPQCTEEPDLKPFLHHFSEKKGLFFWVKDTGIGIPEEKKDLLFQDFQQLDSSITKKYGGTGLGLSISKKLTQKLGGEIFFESAIDVGTTFFLFLPEETIKESEQEFFQNKNEKKEKKIFYKEKLKFNFSGINILIVDDDIRNVYSLRSFLMNLGAQLKIAYQGREGLSIYEKNEGIHLILTDLMMPEMNGYELITMIRKKDKEVPIFVLSAKTVSGEIEKCLTLGANEYFQKPIDSEKLVESIQKWVRR